MSCFNAYCARVYRRLPLVPCIECMCMLTRLVRAEPTGGGSTAGATSRATNLAPAGLVGVVAGASVDSMDPSSVAVGCSAALIVPSCYLETTYPVTPF
jgi:hypothetical protein